MDITMNDLHNDLLKLRREIDLLKNILSSEGELSEYAKRELKKARKEPESSYLDLESL